jgi:hypothetical protein
MGCYEFNQEGPTITVLSQTSPNYMVPAGYSTIIYGTSSPNVIVLESGAHAELIHFPGQNDIQILSDSHLFTVFRSGTMVTLEGSDGTLLKIPASTTGQTIRFTDMERTLVVDGSQVKLGDQLIELTSAVIVN